MNINSTTLDTTSMVKTLILTNGTAIPLYNFRAYPEHWQNTDRDILEFQIAKGTIPFNTLDALTKTDSNNIKNFTITETVTEEDSTKNINTYTYTDYGIRIKLSSESVCTKHNLGNIADVYTELIILKLAQYSYTEMQLTLQQAEIEALTLSSLGVK